MRSAYGGNLAAARFVTSASRHQWGALLAFTSETFDTSGRRVEDGPIQLFQRAHSFRRHTQTSYREMKERSVRYRSKKRDLL